MLSIPFDNLYARLPERFYARLDPTPVAAPTLIKFNHSLATELGIDATGIDDSELATLFGGNATPAGAEPLAMAYSGFQFGHFSPQLGDGRALLLGEVIDQRGHRRDIQLKGSGPTAFSRRGDGRAALGPVLREYLVSEAMAALGVPTTRALAAVRTGQAVMRERPLPGAVLTRVASSHVRVGTFQYFDARADRDAIMLLANHVIERHAPHAKEEENPYLSLFEHVVKKQATLVAEWQRVGFIHGVMNTDNTAVSGETIDYGPCAFLDNYHPGKVFSSIDRQGRYAFQNQPPIARWNLAGLAETLLFLFDDDEERAIELAKEQLEAFSGYFHDAFAASIRSKLGLGEAQSEDMDLARDLLRSMMEEHADYTLTFRRLSDLSQEPSKADDAFLSNFSCPRSAREWLAQWRQRLQSESRTNEERRAVMRSANPAYIPRNHRVEQALRAAEEGNLQPFDHLLRVVRKPYDEQLENLGYQTPPKPEEEVRQTFCGT